MATAASHSRANRIVLIVGIDLDDTSEHLLRTVKELTRGAAEAEVHIVHVVPAETLGERISEPLMSLGNAERERRRVARWQIERLCQAIEPGPTVHVVMHTPAGDPVAELGRLASRLGAGAIVIEAHEARVGASRLFHRSVAAGLAQSAPCSVLTVRAHRSDAATDLPSQPDPRDHW
jgi:nucleotide-binding universal stress UspA family protein